MTVFVALLLLLQVTGPAPVTQGISPGPLPVVAGSTGGTLPAGAPSTGGMSPGGARTTGSIPAPSIEPSKGLWIDGDDILDTSTRIITVDWLPLFATILWMLGIWGLWESGRLRSRKPGKPRHTFLLVWLSQDDLSSMLVWAVALGATALALYYPFLLLDAPVRGDILLALLRSGSGWIATSILLACVAVYTCAGARFAMAWLGRTPAQGRERRDATALGGVMSLIGLLSSIVTLFTFFWPKR